MNCILQRGIVSMKKIKDVIEIPSKSNFLSLGTDKSEFPAFSYVMSYHPGLKNGKREPAWCTAAT